MNMKTVEGLVGARTNINLSYTAMNIYWAASQKGDTAAMERALGYAGQLTYLPACVFSFFIFQSTPPCRW